MEEYLETRVLTSRLVLDNLMALYDLLRDRGNHLDIHNAATLANLQVRIEIQQGLLRITEAIKLFEAEVWFGGLQAAVRSNRSSQIGAEAGDLKVLTFTTAGRTLITVSDVVRGTWVSLVADETSSEPRSGFQGVGATADEAVSLLRSAVKAKELLVWAERPCSFG